MDPIIDYRGAKPASLAVSKFMSHVYGWMTFGLLITGVMSYVVGTDPELALGVRHNMGLTIGAYFLLFFGLNWGINRVSVGVATLLFILFSFVNGAMLSSIFLIYSLPGITQTFIVTAGAFAGLSLYGTVTKRDLTAIGTFMGMAVWGLIFTMALNILWFKSGGLDLAISAIGVVAFSALTAWDTQKLRAFSTSGQANTDEGQKVAIIGALMLYLDFINLFLFLLRFMGGRGGSRRDY